MSKEEYILLYERVTAGQATPEEATALRDYKDDFELKEGPWLGRMGDRESTRQAIYNRLSAALSPRKNAKIIWLRRAASVAAVLVLLAGGLWLTIDKQKPKVPTGSVSLKPELKDRLPGGEKAVLTLADGSQIILDSAGNGSLARQSGIKVIKLNGQVQYSKDGQAAAGGKPEYNTISTPKGGQYQLVLADGTNVWLNASSSLRYPVAFTGGERNVELTGEGYFEVAHNRTQPFSVKLTTPAGDGGIIEVLGTHFNINSYANEESTKTTLLEGKVKVVSKDRQAMILSPGQQAQMTENAIHIMANADTEEAVAWKNGLFQFTNSSLKQILRQVERWYDVTVDYEGLPDKHFYGMVPRSSSLMQVLKMIAVTSGVQLKLSGNTVQLDKQ